MKKLFKRFKEWANEDVGKGGLAIPETRTGWLVMVWSYALMLGAHKEIAEYGLSWDLLWLIPTFLFGGYFVWVVTIVIATMPIEEKRGKKAWYQIATLIVITAVLVYYSK